MESCVCATKFKIRVIKNLKAKSLQIAVLKSSTTKALDFIDSH